jgi:hypothetical protein
MHAQDLKEIQNVIQAFKNSGSPEAYLEWASDKVSLPFAPVALHAGAILYVASTEYGLFVGCPQGFKDITLAAPGAYYSMKTFLIDRLNLWSVHALISFRAIFFVHLFTILFLLLFILFLHATCHRTCHGAHAHPLAHSLVPRLEEVTPQLKGDHVQLRLTRKEVNDEINHIYWAGAKMRAHFNRLPQVCARNAPHADPRASMRSKVTPLDPVTCPTFFF